MPKFNLDIPYNRINVTPTKEDPGYQTDPQLTEHYIIQAFRQVYPQGVSQDVRLVYADIQKKFDIAFTKKNYIVNLTEQEANLLATTVKSATFPAEISKLIISLDEALSKFIAKPTRKSLTSKRVEKPNV